MSSATAFLVQSGVGLLLAGLVVGLWAGLHLGRRPRSAPLAEADGIPAGQLKSGFLANLSHEMRAPLSSIIGFSDLILDGAEGNLTVEQREDLTQISSAGRTLLRLANDLFDLYRIEAGRMSLEIGPVNLGSVIREVALGLRPQAQAKSLALEVQISAGLPLAGGDVMRVRQILTHLVANAIRFTDQGRVTVSCDLSGQTLEVVVADTGIGIPAPAVDGAFDEFAQVEGADGRRLEGTGLGLAITRRLLQLQGGEVGVESQVGQGSRFWFRLPISEEQAIEVPGPRDDSLPEQVTRLLGSASRRKRYLPG